MSNFFNKLKENKKLIFYSVIYFFTIYYFKSVYLNSLCLDKDIQHIMFYIDFIFYLVFMLSQKLILNFWEFKSIIIELIISLFLLFKKFFSNLLSNYFFLYLTKKYILLPWNYKLLITVFSLITLLLVIIKIWHFLKKKNESSDFKFLDNFKATIFFLIMCYFSTNNFVIENIFFQIIIICIIVYFLLFYLSIYLNILYILFFILFSYLEFFTRVFLTICLVIFTQCNLILIFVKIKNKLFHILCLLLLILIFFIYLSYVLKLFFFLSNILITPFLKILFFDFFIDPLEHLYKNFNNVNFLEFDISNMYYCLPYFFLFV